MPRKSRNRKSGRNSGSSNGFQRPEENTTQDDPVEKDNQNPPDEYRIDSENLAGTEDLTVKQADENRNQPEMYRIHSSSSSQNQPEMYRIHSEEDHHVAVDVAVDLDGVVGMGTAVGTHEQRADKQEADDINESEKKDSETQQPLPEEGEDLDVGETGGDPQLGETGGPISNRKQPSQQGILLNQINRISSRVDRDLPERKSNGPAGESKGMEGGSIGETKLAASGNQSSSSPVYLPIMSLEGAREPPQGHNSHTVIHSSKRDGFKGSSKKPISSPHQPGKSKQPSLHYVSLWDWFNCDRFCRGNDLCFRFYWETPEEFFDLYQLLICLRKPFCTRRSPLKKGQLREQEKGTAAFASSIDSTAEEPEPESDDSNERVHDRKLSATVPLTRGVQTRYTSSTSSGSEPDNAADDVYADLLEYKSKYHTWMVPKRNLVIVVFAVVLLKLCAGTFLILGASVWKSGSSKGAQGSSALELTGGKGATKRVVGRKGGRLLQMIQVADHTDSG